MGRAVEYTIYFAGGTKISMIQGELDREVTCLPNCCHPSKRMRLIILSFGEWFCDSFAGN